MPASINANVSENGRVGHRGSYTLMVRDNWLPADFLVLLLNDEFEYRLSLLLRTRDTKKDKGDKQLCDIVHEFAVSMAHAIPGYEDWPSIEQYVLDCLESELEEPDNDKSENIGNESNLVELLSKEELIQYQWDEVQNNKYALKKPFRDNLSDNIAICKRRTTVLDGAREEILNKSDKEKRLFRKIFYTYKLVQAISEQVGYFGGSLEFYCDIDIDFEYWMYLISMKTRRHDRQNLYKSPKPMAFYSTPSTSLLPWNNQFSFSFGFDEFAPGEIPRVPLRSIEERLRQVLSSQDTWHSFRILLDWDYWDASLDEERRRLIDPVRNPFQQTVSTQLSDTESGLFYPRERTLRDLGFRHLNIQNIIERILEIKKDPKSLFADILAIPWSDEPSHPAGEGVYASKTLNAFDDLLRKPNISAQMRRAATLGRLNFLARDPRLRKQAPNESSLSLVSTAAFLPNVVGRKANIMLDPKSAADRFESKLELLGKDDLKSLYHGQIDESLNDKKAIIKSISAQAVKKAEEWRDSVLINKMPIYTGPSGHTLGYLNLYAHSVAEMSDADRKKASYPNMQEARLVLMAGLIGFSQHHTYDEVMTASTGLKIGEDVLKYEHRGGYQDLINIQSTVLSQYGFRDMILNEMKDIVKTVIREYKIAQKDIAEANKKRNEKEPEFTVDDPKPIAINWYRSVTGETFPEAELD